MSPRSLRLLRLASHDLDKLSGYVFERSGAATAASWRNGLLARVARLLTEAEVWPFSEEPGYAEAGIRELLYRRHKFVYRIFYRVAGDEVIVHRIRSAFQDSITIDDL